VPSTATSIDWSAVRNAYGTFTAANPPSDEEGSVIATPKFDTIVNDTSDSEFFAKARAYAERLGTANTPDGHAFVNGKHYLFDDVSHECDTY
jgi:UDP-glucose:glycoprotein glucosyltransferase